MQWKNVDQGSQSASQLGQPARIRIAVVDSTYHYILECHPSAKRLGRPEDRLKIILLLDRHDPEPLLRGRRVERNGQTKLLRSLGEFRETRKDPHCRHRDVPCANSEAETAVQNAQGRIH